MQVTRIGRSCLQAKDKEETKFIIDWFLYEQFKIIFGDNLSEVYIEENFIGNGGQIENTYGQITSSSTTIILGMKNSNHTINYISIFGYQTESVIYEKVFVS